MLIKDKYSFTYLLLLLLVFCKPQVPLSQIGYELIYDEGHGNVWGIWDTGFYGYSEFARTIKQQKILVSLNAEKLELLLGQIPEADLFQKILVLNVAKYKSYTNEEISSVESFVKKGGKLIIIGEHDNMYGVSDFQNAIASRFGLFFNHNSVGNPYISERRSQSDVFNLKNVFDQLSASIRYSSKDATVLLFINENNRKVPTCVGVKVGKGKVVALGDSELFWNGDGKVGINRGENKQFLLHLISWITDQKIEQNTYETKTIFLTNKKPSVKPKKMFIDTSSFGRDIDNSRSGLNSFAHFFQQNGFDVTNQKSTDYDIRVVVGALSKIDYNKNDKAKNILFLEAYDNLESFSYWDKFHIDRGNSNLESIYIDLENAWNIKISPCFITNGNQENVFNYPLKISNHIISIQRSGCIQKKFIGNFISWIEANENQWGEITHPGMENNHNSLLDSNDIEKPIFSFYNQSNLIFLDSDFISNSNQNKLYYPYMLEQILKWIQGDYEALHAN